MRTGTTRKIGEDYYIEIYPDGSGKDFNKTLKFETRRSLPAHGQGCQGQSPIFVLQSEWIEKK